MEMKAQQTGHPGPYCIICKQPFGVPYPIGTLSTPEGPVPCYSQEVVGTSTESFCRCLDCMQAEKRIMEERFEATLAENQKRMYKELRSISSDISSYFMLMS